MSSVHELRITSTQGSTGQAISCSCRLVVVEPTDDNMKGGGRDSYEPFGISRSWTATIRLFNNGEHNGEFDVTRHGIGRARRLGRL